MVRASLKQPSINLNPFQMPVVLTQGRIVVSGDFVTGKIVEFTPDGSFVGYKLNFLER